VYASARYTLWVRERESKRTALGRRVKEKNKPKIDENRPQT
jgi:hypothetical protein